MARRRHYLFAAVVAWSLAACAAADPPEPAPMLGSHTGDPARGLAYARETCAACHAVEAGETQSPYPDATAFAELAVTPGMTSLALTVWLNSSHEQMPNFIVDPERIDDLAAYMASLDR